MLFLFSKFTKVRSHSLIHMETRTKRIVVSPKITLRKQIPMRNVVQVNLLGIRDGGRVECPTFTASQELESLGDDD